MICHFGEDLCIVVHSLGTCLDLLTLAQGMTESFATLPNLFLFIRNVVISLLIIAVMP